MKQTEKFSLFSEEENPIPQPRLLVLFCCFSTDFFMFAIAELPKVYKGPGNSAEASP